MTRPFITSLLLMSSLSILAQEKLQIKGEITGISAYSKITLSGDVEEQEVVLDGDRFELEMELKEAPTLVSLLAIDGSDYKYTNFFVGNESIVIKGSVNDMPGNIKAQNSKYDGLRYEEFVMNRELSEEYLRLNEEIGQLLAEGKSRDSLLPIYISKTEPLGKMTKVMNAMSDNTFEFLKRNINTEYGRSILRYQTSEFTTKQYETLLTLVDPVFRDTQEIKYIQALVDFKPLDVGDKYYDFEALDEFGKTVQFNEFFTGKYVMVDFSTFNCGYCHMAAPRIAELEEELKDRLTVVTYYVDNDLENLKQYKALKGNTGCIIYSNEGGLSETIAKYRQTGTPRYALFNAEGEFVENFEGLQQEDFAERLKDLMDK